MIATSGRGTRFSRLLAVVFSPLLAGRGSASSGPNGIRVVVRRDAIYMIVPVPAAARAMCVAAGMGAPGLDRPVLMAAGQPTASDGGAAAAGCRGLVRSVIVCANGDERCLRHEERHAREGAFHQ